MMKLTLFLLIFTCICFADINDDIRKMVMDAMDLSIDPCSDFYNYSCGGWMQSNSIPPDDSRYFRSFSVIAKRNEETLRAILEDKYNNSKINLFYRACMNVSATEDIDTNPIEEYFDLIDTAEEEDDFMFVVGFLQGMGVGALFNLAVERDSKHPEIDIALFNQGGISLPDESFYDDDNKDLLDQYETHIFNMFELFGFENPDELAQKALQFENDLAKIMVPSDELMNPFDTYNKINISGLNDLTDLPWDDFLVGLGFPNLVQLSVNALSFFGNMSIVIDANRENWIPYLRWKLLHQFAGQLSQKYVDEDFNFFGKILSGQKAPLPRWRKCVASTDEALPELTGYEYAMKSFPGASRKIAEQILESIEQAMYGNLKSIPWMDSATRSYAITKLNAIANMIGFPDPPYSYPDFQPTSYTYLSNTLEANLLSIARKLNNVGKPSDRYQWGMSADTVNAYYDPTRNEMVFPAGILQTTFFNLSFPVSMNYGGIGMVMGHELTHGFDNQGRVYDAEGVLRDWWTPDTSKKFNDKVQCVIDQYSKFEVLPGIFVNGKLTQGENIADMGGIKNAYNSYVANDANADKPSIVPNLTNKQLFFISFAQNWCSLITPAKQEILVKVDPHSPARFRVLGPLINLPEFAQTFKCKKGSNMNPINHCEVW